MVISCLDFSVAVITLFLLVINSLFGLVESSSSLQCESQIKLLIEFDSGYHGVAHLVIFSINVLDHDIFAFLLFEFV